MKRLLAFVTLCAATLCADEECPIPTCWWDFHPLHVGGNAIAVGKAKVDAPEKGHITYNKENAFVYLLLPINKETFFFPRLEYNTFSLDWDHNPKFHKSRYQYLQLAINFYTIAVEKWRWIIRSDYNLDLDHFDKPDKYGLFSTLLWGAHEISPKWHYHIGGLGYVGMEGQVVYPLIGIDYTLNEKWFFQVLFPINYSVEYSFNKNWKLSLKAHPIKERFRTGAQEPQPRSVFCYSTIGAEFNLQYARFLRLEAEIYAGYNFGGSFYIKNRNGHHAIYTDVKGAPYAGASLNFGF